MEDAPVQTTNRDACEKPNDNTRKFLGTDNPRHVRAINALMDKPQYRKNLDSIIGCANTPELIAELRRLGLDAICERVLTLDRDGKITRPGIYMFLDADRQKIIAWRHLRKANTPENR